MRLGDGHQRHVAEDAHRGPVVEAVELVALEARIDAHRQPLRLALEGPSCEMGRQVEQASVVARLPRADMLVVEPQVVASQHAVEPYVNLLPLPRRRHGERRTIVARQRVGVVILRLAETISLPAAGHRNVAFLPVHLQLPRAVQRFHHRLVGDGPDALEGILHTGTAVIADDANGLHPGKHAPPQVDSPVGIEVQPVGLQAQVAGIHHVEVAVFARQPLQCLHNEWRTLPAVLGKRAADDGQRGVLPAPGLLDQMLTDIGNDRLQVVVVAVGGGLVALALMPDQAFDVVIVGQLVETVVNLLAESPEQRLLLGIDAPEPAVGAVLACGVDSRAPHRLLDDVERLLPALLQQIIDNGIEAPAVAQVCTAHGGCKRLERPRGFREVAAAVAPLAVVVPGKLGQLGNGYTPVGIALSGGQDDGNRLFCSESSDAEKQPGECQRKSLSHSFLYLRSILVYW